MHKFLSEPVEQLFTQTESPETFDVLIIGSGYGGSVAARLLSDVRNDGKPLNIAVLERGREYRPGDYPTNIDELPGHISGTIVTKPDAAAGPDDSEPGSTDALADTGLETRSFRNIGVGSGLFEFTVGEGVATLTANGLGGGSLINAGVLEEVLPEKFSEARWPAVFQDKTQRDALYERTRELLDATRQNKPVNIAQSEHRATPLLKRVAFDTLAKGKPLKPWHPTNRKAGIGLRHATLGIAMEGGLNNSGVEMNPCILCGDCTTGCNHGAKQSLDHNLLRYAQARGVRLYTGANVSHLDQSNDSGTWQVHLNFTNENIKRYQESADAGNHRLSNKKTLHLSAHNVIVASGVLGSTRILARSKYEAQRHDAEPGKKDTREQQKNLLSGISESLGCGFSGNGEFITAVYNMNQTVNTVALDTLAPASRMVGPTITTVATFDGDTEKSWVMEDISIANSLKWLMGESIATSRAFQAIDQCDTRNHTEGMPDFDPFGVDIDALQRTQILGMMGDDGAKGTMRLVTGKPTDHEDGDQDYPAFALELQWKKYGELPVFQDMHDTVQRLVNSSGSGGQVLPNPLWKLFPEGSSDIFGQPDLPHLTTHPLGGCALGSTPDQAVVDTVGRVFSSRSGVTDVIDSLMVMDGSVIPQSLGINPALTIAAFSVQATDDFIRRNNFDVSSKDVSVDVLQRMPAVRDILKAPVTEHHPADTDVELSERMSGIIKLRNSRGKIVEKRLEITLESNPFDLERAFSALSKEEAETARTLHFSPAYSARNRIRLFDPKKWKDICDREIDSADRDRKLNDIAEVNLPISGTARLFTRSKSQFVRRTRKAIVYWYRNRGSRDIYQEQQSGNKIRDIFKRFYGLIKIASKAGEKRKIEYSFLILDDQTESGVSPDRVDAELASFSPGQVVEGHKLITYGRHANPWLQLQVLNVTQCPHMDTGSNQTIRYDIEYATYAAKNLISVVRHRTLVRSLLAKGSVALYVMRMVLSIHLWAFRKPDDQSAYMPASDSECADEHETADAPVESEFASPSERQNATVNTPRRIAINRSPRLCDSDDRGDVHVCPVADLVAQYKERFPGIELRDSGEIVLTRFTPLDGNSERLPENVPVILIHGYDASGTTFAHPALSPSLAQYLTEQKRDVWVLDLQSSTAHLKPAKPHPWRFEETSLIDIPLAVHCVRESTGASEVDIVAHCMGSVAFSMAVLGTTTPVSEILGMDAVAEQRSDSERAVESGCDPLPVGCVPGTPSEIEMVRSLPTSIRSAILMQVPPAVRFSPGNLMRAYTTNFFRRAVADCDWSPQPKPDATGFDDWINRLAYTFPYDLEDREITDPQERKARREFAGTRHRIDAVLGQVFPLKSMSLNTLEYLNDLFGPMHLATVGQVGHFARLNAITNHKGRNVHVYPEKARRHWQFPTLYLYGGQNRIVNPYVSESCFNEFAQRANMRLGTLGFHDFGHQDCLIGEHPTTIFREINRFLDDSEPFINQRTCVYDGINCCRPSNSQDKAQTFQLSPVAVGPLHEYQSLARQGTESNIRLRLSFGIKEEQVSPLALVAVCVTREGGHYEMAIPDNPLFHSADTAASSTYIATIGSNEHDWYYVGSNESLELAGIPCPWVGDIPESAGLLLFTLDEVSGQPDASLLPELLDGYIGSNLINYTCDKKSHGAAHQSECMRCRLQALFKKVPDSVSELLSDANNEDEFCFVRLKHYSRDTKCPASFLVASCQYPPGVFDEKPAYRSLEHMTQHAQRSEVPVEFALLLGDQIYRDATRGLFDPEPLADGYRKPYFKLFSAPQFRRFSSQLPIITLFDDHEITDNWEGRPIDYPSIAIDCFAQFQRSHIQLPRSGSSCDGQTCELEQSDTGASIADGEDQPSRETESQASTCLTTARLNPSGVVRDIEPSHSRGFYLAVIDTRLNRQPRSLKNVHEGRLVDRTKLRNTVRQLKEWPEDQFKFLAMSSIVLPRHIDTGDTDLKYPYQSDSWSGYLDDLRELLGLIAIHKIKNVVFLSGDEHVSSHAMLTVRMAGKEPVLIHQIHSSPLYAPYPFGNTRADQLISHEKLHFEVSDIESLTVAGGSSELQVTVQTEFFEGDGFASINRTRDESSVRVIFHRPNGLGDDCSQPVDEKVVTLNAV